MTGGFCSLDGKNALVTGASRGIGRAIATELAAAGATVVLSYRTGVDEAEALAVDIGARAVQADVSDPESARTLVETAGDLDILVNNAGVTRDGLLVRMSDDDWNTVLDTNLASCLYTCRAAARGMMKRRSGAVVNISSIVGIHGNWGQTNYAASKAGIIGFTKALARAVLLPAAQFFLMDDRKPPVRRLTEGGVPVVLATDFNPGSCPTEAMGAALEFGCLSFRLTVDEAITAATLNAAASLGLASETGSLEPGKRADLVVHAVPNRYHLVYRFGVRRVRAVVAGGRIRRGEPSP